MGVPDRIEIEGTTYHPALLRLAIPCLGGLVVLSVDRKTALAFQREISNLSGVSRIFLSHISHTPRGISWLSWIGVPHAVIRHKIDGSRKNIKIAIGRKGYKRLAKLLNEVAAA